MSASSFVTVALFLTTAYAADPFIWPLPLSYTVDGPLNVDNGFTMTTTSKSTILQDAIDRYRNEIIFTHIPDKAPSSLPLTSSLSISTKSDDETLQFGVDESYNLEIRQNISTLYANTIYGAMRGLETFSQAIVYNFTLGYYQTMDYTISDKPRFGWRGTLIDTSRHYQSPKSIKNLLNAMSYAKLNILHWHIVDTQSFPYTSEIYPKLAQYGAYTPYEQFSLNDIKDIVQYAKERGITIHIHSFIPNLCHLFPMYLGIRVVPEFDIPGHTGSWCKGYPEICPNPACNTDHTENDSPDGILNPANDFTFELIEGLFNEVTTVFPDEYLHIGGDETQTACWDNTTEIIDWKEQNGFSDKDALDYFNSRAYDIVHSKLKNARKPIQWDEMFTLYKDVINPIDTPTLFQVWHNADLVADIVSAGFEAIFSPNADWYLDHSTPWTKMYMTEPAAYTNAEDEFLLLGGAGEMWGETVDVSDIEQTIWPRMGAIAERLWSPREVNDTVAAQPRYEYFRCLLNQRGIAAAPSSSTLRSAPGGPGSCYDQ